MKDIRFIGQRIKSFRKQQNLTIKELANKINSSAGYLSDIENGKTLLSINKLIDICDALGVTLSEFFSIDDEDSDSLPTEYIELVKNAKNLSPEQLKILNDFIKNF